MRTIQQIVMSAVLVLSASTAMAATEIKKDGVAGFHAMSQITSTETKPITVLSDSKLDGIVGGYNPFKKVGNKFGGLKLLVCRTGACGAPIITMKK